MQGHGTVRTYSVGFLLSLLLTGAAYISVAHHIFAGLVLLSIIVLLAIVQFFVQLIFFLHLGSESKSHWNQTMFSFMLLVLVILVFGSLWIMGNLNYHMDNPHNIDQTIMDDEEIHDR